MKYKVGDTHRIRPNGWRGTAKSHVLYVLDSIYENEKLIVVKIWIKHKKYWNEFMYYENDFTHKIEMAKILDND